MVRKLAPDVVRAVLREGEDWSGDPALYIRVIVTDGSLGMDREVSRRVRKTMTEDLRLDELDRISYFKFRTVSEQEALREPSWE